MIQFDEWTVFPCEEDGKLYIHTPDSYFLVSKTRTNAGFKRLDMNKRQRKKLSKKDDALCVIMMKNFFEEFYGDEKFTFHLNQLMKNEETAKWLTDRGVVTPILRNQ